MDRTTMASAIRYNCLRLPSSTLMCPSLSLDRLIWLPCGTSLVLSCASSRGERELWSGGGVAGSGVGPGLDDQDDGLVQGAAPGVAFAAGVVLLAPVVGAGLAELAEGDRVAAGFGQEVAAVAEHVRPGTEPLAAGAASAAELPGGGDHLPVVGRAAQLADLGLVLKPVGRQAGHGQRLGG